MSENLDRYCVCMTAGDLPPEDVELLQGMRAALLKAARWPDRSAITVRFLGGDRRLQERVRQVAEEWTQPGMANLRFDFPPTAPTNIRIAFQPGKGSWSYLGTMCQQIPEPQPTMNYGWLTPDSSDDELRRVVLHEFGHALGLIHEHQNPEGGIKWNKDAVIRDLSGPPNNWSRQEIDINVLLKYAADSVSATTLDADSIMMYPIPAAWTENGYFSADLNRDLSPLDKRFIALTYH